MIVLDALAIMSDVLSLVIAIEHAHIERVATNTASDVFDD